MISGLYASITTSEPLETDSNTVHINAKSMSGKWKKSNQEELAAKHRGGTHTPITLAQEILLTSNVEKAERRKEEKASQTTLSSKEKNRQKTEMMQSKKNKNDRNM